jgi:hypothetical protein
MALITLLQLRTSARQESDQVNSLFCTDAEVNGYIRTAYADLYGNIVQHFGNDYFVQTPAAGYTFTTDGINQLFALPMTGGVQLMFKLLGVEALVSGSTQYVSLKPFAFADRNRLSFPGSQIPPAGQTVRILYVPLPTLPTQDADTIDGVNGWEESIVIDVAMKMMAKEESDVSVLQARRRAMDERLASEIENRNASEHGGKIVDVERQSRGCMQYRLNGNNLWLIGSALPAPMYGGYENEREGWF